MIELQELHYSLIVGQDFAKYSIVIGRDSYM